MHIKLVSNFLQFLLLIPTLGHSNQPVKATSRHNVENDIDPNKPKVSPSIFEERVNGRKVSVSVSHCAVATERWARS